MYKCKNMAILAVLISLVCIMSACNNGNVTNTTKGEDNSTNVDKKIQNTDPVMSASPDNIVQVTPSVNSGEGFQDITIKEKIMGSVNKQLNEESFGITYKSIEINQNKKVEDITKKLRFPEDYEANNQGYISGNSKYRRWNLCYPNYSKPEIRIIVLSEIKYVGEEVKDGNSYIVGVYLESYSTNKGLKVGDGLEKVLQLYGRPNSFEKDNENGEGLYFLKYTKADLNLDITLDKDMEKVESIFIDYNMKKSTEEQQGTNN